MTDARHGLRGVSDTRLLNTWRLLVTEVGHLPTGQSITMERLLRVPIGLNNHEFAPRIAVVRFLAPPRKMRRRNTSVSDALISARPRGLPEGVGDGLAIEPDSSELLRS